MLLQGYARIGCGTWLKKGGLHDGFAGKQKIMRHLNTSKMTSFAVHACRHRLVVCAALLMLSLLWPGMALADSSGKYATEAIGMSDLSVIIQEDGVQSPAEESIAMDAQDEWTSIFRKTLDDAEIYDEAAATLPLDEELDDTRLGPASLPSITDVGAPTNRTSTYYLTKGRTNPAPTLILAYDAAREDEFLYGMISLTIRW